VQDGPCLGKNIAHCNDHYQASKNYDSSATSRLGLTPSLSPLQGGEVGNDLLLQVEDLETFAMQRLNAL
jgi:hypothetical protein